MVKGRNTIVVSFRIQDSDYERLESLASKRGMSVGDYCKWAVLKLVLKKPD